MDAINEQGKKKVSVITVDEHELQMHVSEVVRQSVEETLNGLLDAEAEELCRAKRYERNAARVSTRAGHYERNCRPSPARFVSRFPSCGMWCLKPR